MATATSQTATQVSVQEARLDDAENRSRRNNLSFYGIADDKPPKMYAQSEELITWFWRDHLKITVESKDVEPAHHIGRHSQDRCRPIIVKFTSFKTKQAVLATAPQLKGTDFSIGEDFSHRVPNTQKHLLAFAKKKIRSFPFTI